VVVWLCAAVAYAITRSAVPALTHDSMGYLLAIERGGDALFHPHHLAYNAVASGWLDLARAVGVDASAIDVVEVLNGLFGATAVTLVWLILRSRAQLTRLAAAAGTAGAALSFGVWFYSVSVEVYVLPLALLLATFFVLTVPQLTPARLVAVGALNGLAVLGHQTNVLFAAVVLAVVVTRVPRPDRPGLLVRYAVSATGVVVAAYGAVLGLAVRPRSLGDAASWFTRYAQDQGAPWEASPMALPKAAVGLGRALVGGHAAFRLEAVRDRAASLFAGRSLSDEAFLVRDLPPAVAVLIVALALAAAVTLAALVVSGLRAPAPPDDPAGRLVLPLVVWLAAYAAFFLLWEPVNPEFWIPQVTVAWMLAAIAAARVHRAAALAAVAAAVGAVNLFGTVLPATDAGNDIYAVRYAALADLVDGGDIAIIDRPHLGLGYAERVTDATPVAVIDFSIDVDPADDGQVPAPAEIVARADAALEAGHRVAVDGDLLRDPSSRDAERTGERLEEEFAARWRLARSPAGEGWYVIEP
jgi:hypothetical protein